MANGLGGEASEEEEQRNAVSEAVNEAQQAYAELSLLPQSGREVVIESIRSMLSEHVSKIADMEFVETGMGDARDKAEKLMLALNKTPGVEALTPQISASDDGYTIYEYSPYGVVCATQPATNACATMVSNIIGMIAAGNSVIIIPHPKCMNVSSYTTGCINEAIKAVSGIESLVTALPQTSVQSAAELMGHPKVSMVVATGGGKMIRQALSASKRVIVAGSANPVAMVDETANLSQAAKNIAESASFDHNTTCVGEKNIVVVSAVAEKFIEELRTQGVYFVDNRTDMLKLTRTTINNNFIMERSMAGKSARQILDAADIAYDGDVRLIVVETTKTHPFVTIEMLMPLVPLVRVENFEELLSTALFIEQGHRHTATFHSQNIARLNKAAQVMQTSVFVRNGSSLSALGFDGDTGTGFTIANITGEGVISAQDFARRRRCSLKTGLSQA